MKGLILSLFMLPCLGLADRLEDEAKVQGLWKDLHQAASSWRELSQKSPASDSLTDMDRAYNEAQRQEDVVKLLGARFTNELARFVLVHRYLPVDIDTYKDENGGINFKEIEISLNQEYRCVRIDRNRRNSHDDCSMELRQAERRNQKFAKIFKEQFSEKSRNNEENTTVELSFEPPKNPVEDLGRGYKRRISGAGVLTIERAYPNSKSPKMILIAYEGIDKLEKDTVVPLVFTYGDKNKDLEFQIGHEIPEDEVTKGRRILSLQILRFKKKPKEKPDGLSNKELAAIADFIKQFDGKEISDPNNVLLTEIYPDPDNVKQQIAATWRVPFETSKPSTELGFQRVVEVSK